MQSMIHVISNFWCFNQQFGKFHETKQALIQCHKDNFRNFLKFLPIVR